MKVHFIPMFAAITLVASPALAQGNENVQRANKLIDAYELFFTAEKCLELHLGYPADNAEANSAAAHIADVVVEKAMNEEPFLDTRMLLDIAKDIVAKRRPPTVADCRANLEHINNLR